MTVPTRVITDHARRLFAELDDDELRRVLDHPGRPAEAPWALRQTWEALRRCCAAQFARRAGSADDPGAEDALVFAVGNIGDENLRTLAKVSPLPALGVTPTSATRVLAALVSLERARRLSAKHDHGEPDWMMRQQIAEIGADEDETG